MKPTAVFVVPASTDGRILVVKHRQKSYYRDLGEQVWGLSGGGIDPQDGGSPIVTAIREVREETGLSVRNFRLVCDFIQRSLIKDQPGKYNLNGLKLLCCKPDNIESAVGFTSYEIEEVRLIRPAEILQMLDVFLLAHLRMVLTYYNFLYDPRLLPASNSFLSKPVECPSLGVRDRELLSVLRL